jgi:phage repressor protein C with HTH and peptisase S24 domain
MTGDAARDGRPDIPVWAAAQAGDEGALILVPDPVDYIFRSERMRGVRNPFAFQIVGGSMSPALEHGDQVVINPALLIRPGVDCVFVQQQKDGTFLALVKRLLRQSADTWHVRQFDPKKDFELSKKKWPRAHVVAEIRRGGL